MDSLAKQYLETQREIGRLKSGTTVTIPKQDASDEDKAAFWKSLGRPDKPEEYELPTEGIPENAAWLAEDPMVAKFREEAHQHGLSRQQTAALYRWYAENSGALISETEAQQAQQTEQWDKDIRKELGPAYEESIGLAQRAIDKFGGDELRAALNESGLGNHPALIKAWVQIGRAVASDEIIGEGSRRTFVPTPEEAVRNIEEMKGSAASRTILTNPSHEKYPETKKRWDELHKIAYPDQTT